VSGHTGDGFIAHYLLPMVSGGVRTVVVPLIVVVVNAAAYAGYIKRRRRDRTGPELTEGTGRSYSRR
jgi:hypothetical protein